MENLMNFDQTAMTAWCQAQGLPRFRARQILQWVHQHAVVDFDGMTTLSKALREQLKGCALLASPKPSQCFESRDGTTKWLFQLDDGNQIETVFIPDKGRGTLCVSSQVGCALQCDFCATGDQGFARNLTVAEIIGQLWYVQHALRKKLGRKHPVTNVVMMGMGEPLLNYDAVLAAMNLMMDDLAYGLSKYRVTLSTSGVVPAMKRLASDSPVSLAVSLHAPDDALRDQLVPINQRYPLSELMAVCRAYFPQSSRRQVTFEYVMLADVNDQIHHAKALRYLLHGIPCKVNLIPFNPYPGGRYTCAKDVTIARFQRILADAGVNTIVRRTRGDDIHAACGQLMGQFQDRSIRTASGRAWQIRRRIAQKRMAASAA